MLVFWRVVKKYEKSFLFLTDFFFVTLPVVVALLFPLIKEEDSSSYKYETWIAVLAVLFVFVLFFKIGYHLHEKEEKIKISDLKEEINELNKENETFRNKKPYIVFHDICGAFIRGALQHIAHVWEFKDTDRISIYAKIDDAYHCLFRLAEDKYKNIDYSKKYAVPPKRCIETTVATSIVQRKWQFQTPSDEDCKKIEGVSNEDRSVNPDYLRVMNYLFNYTSEDVKEMCMRSGCYIACSFSQFVKNDIKLYGAIVIESTVPKRWGSKESFDNNSMKQKKMCVTSVLDSIAFWLEYAERYYLLKCKLEDEAKENVKSFTEF